MNGKKNESENVFSYTEYKNGKVIIYWKSQKVKTLKGKSALKFLNRIMGTDDMSAQLIMAKATGNFKRGNERD